MVRLAHDNFMGYQQLGTTYQLLGEADKAVASYRQSIAIRPSPAAYSNIGALLYGRGDFTGAVDAYHQSLQLRPNSALTHRNLGDALKRLGRTKDAHQSYLEAVRLGEIDLKVNPSDPRTLSLLAVAAQKAGLTDMASRHIDEAMRIAPDNAEVLYRSATVHQLAGRSSAVLPALEQAVSRGYSRTFMAQDDEFVTLFNASTITTPLSDSVDSATRSNVVCLTNNQSLVACA